MRIAIISDIHGNDLAFAMVVADIEADRVDHIVCLGDAIQGGAQPAEVVHRLRGLGCPVVMGNADDWLLKGQDTDPEAPATDWMKRVRDWQLSQLSRDDLKFIASFQPKVELLLPNGKQLVCGHGSPQSFYDVILPDVPEDVVLGMLGSVGTAIVCGGHTRLQQLRQLGKRFFFNPGSVGLPFRHDVEREPPLIYHWAEYAVLNVGMNGRETIEFRRVPYDVGLAIATIESSGMPEPERLLHRYRDA